MCHGDGVPSWNQFNLCSGQLGIGCCLSHPLNSVNAYLLTLNTSLLRKQWTGTVYIVVTKISLLMVKWPVNTSIRFSLRMCKFDLWPSFIHLLVDWSKCTQFECCRYFFNFIMDHYKVQLWCSFPHQKGQW